MRPTWEVVIDADEVLISSPDSDEGPHDITDVLRDAGWHQRDDCDHDDCISIDQAAANTADELWAQRTLLATEAEQIDRLREAYHRTHDERFPADLCHDPLCRIGGRW